MQHEGGSLCRGAAFVQSIVMWKRYSNIDQNKCIVKRTNTYAAFLEGILPRSTLSFDPIGMFFWPTYWVDPPGFGLFALVKCVQWHTPLMCKYRLYWYKTLGWPIAYWFEGAVCSLPRLQVDKNSFCKWARRINPTLRVTYGTNETCVL